MMRFTLTIICGLLIDLIATQEGKPIVSIPDGKLRGTINQTLGENMTYYAFRGIPYAKKPTGELRFAGPQKNDPWNETLDATKDKDQCTQTSSGLGQSGGSQSTIVGSEDCLYINVYTTSINGSSPVMVWIYGGGFFGGSSSYENFAPDHIIEKDIVYVSFNYRLGVFGFLSTEDLIAPGNWGLKDQVLALKWVKENIRYFGGDPDKVTIFGQSAGSASVSYLVQSNLTKDLFKGAIMESGTSLCQWALTRNARRKAFSVGVKLGILTLSSHILIENLRKVDYKRLKLAESNVTLTSFLTESALAGLPFGPVMELPNPDAVITTKSHQTLKEGKFHHVPLIIGFNSNEGAALQGYVNLLRPAFFQYDLDSTRLVPIDLTSNFLTRLIAGINIRNHYFSPGPLNTQYEKILKFVTVDQFNRPIRETVNLMSNFSDVYYYEFSFQGNSSLTSQGVGHAGELDYLFATRGASSSQQKLTREKFVQLWTNFAKTGNPTPSEDSGILTGVKWIPNTPENFNSSAVKYLNINVTLAMETNPDQPDWEFYQTIYKTYGVPPYGTY